MPDEQFKITVVFMDDHYKIYVNDEPLSLTFPYRVEISTATHLWLGGGSNGFTWSSIKMPGDEKSGKQGTGRMNPTKQLHNQHSVTCVTTFERFLPKRAVQTY